MFKKLLGAATIAAASLTASASADVVLGSVELFFGFSSETTDPGIVLGLGLIVDGNSLDPANRLFVMDQVYVTSADVGTTWKGDGDLVEAIRGQLSDDDLADGLGFYAYLGQSDISGFVEEEFLGDDLDFELIVANMDEMHVTLTMYTHQEKAYPGWSDYFFRVRYDFVQRSVPAPGALALLGVAGLMGKRRRR